MSSVTIFPMAPATSIDAPAFDRFEPHAFTQMLGLDLDGMPREPSLPFEA